jgi:hypothetical protein
VRTPSTTALAMITREQALATLSRLASGYTDKSGAGYPAAATNLAGCQLAQKGANREQNGYVQIAPIVTIRTRAAAGQEHKKKEVPQMAHRLVILAHKR